MIKPSFLLVGDDPETRVSEQKTQVVNDMISSVLSSAKNLIDDYGSSGCWDISKTYTNPYELVYKTKAVKVNPVSRAFFKMWEMAVDNEIATLSSSMRIGYVAEGPGGFIQALVEFRRRLGVDVSRDRHTSITLCSAKRHMPCYKFGRDWASSNNVELFEGGDGTGDIYNIENVDAFAKKCRNYDLITADGGFDFSGNFNLQEMRVLRMLVAEILCGLVCLRDGGTFVLKMFDAFSKATSCLVQVLVSTFSEVKCVKPLSSRPANSERYYVCKGFLKEEAKNYTASLRRMLESKLDDYELENLILNELWVSDEVYYQTTIGNISIAWRQLVTIFKTICFIRHTHLEHERTKCRQSQEALADKWVETYMDP